MLNKVILNISKIVACRYSTRRNFRLARQTRIMKVGNVLRFGCLKCYFFIFFSVLLDSSLTRLFINYHFLESVLTALTRPLFFFLLDTKRGSSDARKRLACVVAWYLYKLYINRVPSWLLTEIFIVSDFLYLNFHFKTYMQVSIQRT